MKSLIIKFCLFSLITSASLVSPDAKAQDLLSSRYDSTIFEQAELSTFDDVVAECSAEDDIDIDFGTDGTYVSLGGDDPDMVNSDLIVEFADELSAE